MKKVEIKPLKGVYRLIQKNKEKRAKRRENRKMNAEKYRVSFEHSIAIAKQLSL
ncbi:MAG: hypothetical protein GY827_06045 [Cytophagales bacterium]|nr:hypothetical protein [Cytophagales bacterium]